MALPYQRHLSLGDLKALHVRLLILEAEKASVQQNPDWRNLDAWPKEERLLWKRLRADFEREAREMPGDKSQNSVPLDELVNNLIDKYVPTAREGGSYLGQVVQFVRDGVPKAASGISKRISCQQCVASTKKPLLICHGHPKNDPEVVARGGHCIHPIHDAAQHAVQLAKGLYAEATDLCDIEVVLSTMPGPPSRLGGQLRTVTGELSWKDEESKRKVAVDLTINVREFDDSGLNSLPYCLAHEMVCHAFQEAAISGPRSRDENDEYDALAEGWMDFVVSELIRLRLTPWNDQDVIDAAEGIHLARKREPTEPFSGRVRYGAEAARMVLAWFHLDGRPEENSRDPWHDFVSLSCQLNAHHWPATERNSALMKMPRRLGTFPHDRDLVDALVKWRRDRDTRPWRDAIEDVIRQLRGK